MIIEWHLAEIMANRGFDYIRMAQLTGFHPITVSNHKNRKVMPDRLEANTLKKYCQALNCQPGDLLVYVPTGNIDAKPADS